MTLEITTDAQAEAARELIAAVDKCLTHWPTSSLLTEDAQAALAAYEAQKAVKDIVLSDDELTVLRYAKLGIVETMQAIERLHELDFIDDYRKDGDRLGITASDAGLAYLAQKPRELNQYEFEVWCKGHDNFRDRVYHLFSCHNKQTAIELRKLRADSQNIPVDYYTLREVQ